ncbi:hypothetical protein CYY_002738 [Polysphondylium violaceum]|uniref:Protein phosphatase 4 regulatory subunit 1 n=1 Tax=Polysphondylium violaceum TaxID=133409 RepID=A0A8J4PYU0_9MYCE|nr:hypothetical protein CYY_002738 [Polysphondylium violaceum]
MSDFIGYSDNNDNSFDYDDQGIHNEFEIDDSLPLIDKIQKYVNSELVLHRLYVVREFSEAIRQQFEQVNLILLPIIEEVVGDHEPVIRQALVEQLPVVSQAFLTFGGDVGYSKTLNTLLPLVAQLTTDRNPQVRMSAVEALQDMAKLIKYEDLEVRLIPFIRSLVNDTTDEEHRVQAANLCHNLSPIIGVELTKQVILPFILKLSNDPSFRVRKAIALNLGNICQTIGEKDTTEFLLPIFLALSKDEMWAVRKGCAEVLIVVSQNVSPIERYSKLIQVLEDFISEDTSRWVNNTAFQNLGPFISTFEGSHVTPKLLKYYTDMINPSTIKFPDSDLVTHCAFNFPAVLYTVGSARWPELKDTYLYLVKDPNWKVRRTLSHSIHEIASILGPAETKNSLLPCFNLFLQDLDEVRVGVIRHFGEFLKSLEPSLREGYISTLNTFTNDPSKWRFRKLISKQIGEMCDLFSLKIILTELSPLLLLLLNDPVSKVRNYAASSVGKLIIKILSTANEDTPTTTTTSETSPSSTSNNNSPNTATATTPELTAEELKSLKESTIQQIKDLGTDPSFSNRQVFSKICSYLIDQLEPSYFEANFLATLLDLSSDPVPNVRLVVAETISSKIINNKHFSKNPLVENVLSKLKQDGDGDVSYFGNLTFPQEELEQQQ